MEIEKQCRSVGELPTLSVKLPQNSNTVTVHDFSLDIQTVVPETFVLSQRLNANVSTCMCIMITLSSPVPGMVKMDLVA
jgi:hypothetical protein